MQLLFSQNWQHLTRAIGWTLVHSLWLGLLAAVLSGVIITVTRRTAARYRYNLVAMVLILFLFSVGITFWQQLSGPGNTTSSSTAQKISIVASDVTEDISATTTGKPLSETLTAFFNNNVTVIVCIWAILFLFHCVKLATGLAGIQRLRNYRTQPPLDEWKEKLSVLSRSLGIRRTVQLIESGLVKVPVAIGFFKPVILMPLGLLANLPPQQVETILLHELAHIRRQDYLVNIIQRMTEAVFFFNPALLWISSLLRQEREACCDDVVIAHTTHTVSYLNALVAFQEYNLKVSGYAMAIHSKQHYLLNRVKRMITRENKKLGIMEKTVLIAGMIAMTAFSIIPKQEAAKKVVVINPAALKEKVVAARENSINSGEAVSVQHSNPVVKKRVQDKMVSKPAQQVLPDTVPPKKAVAQERKNDNELQLTNVTTNFNSEGNNKTERISVTDVNGKNVSYVKENGKLTSLTIDGKAIPNNEFDNHKDLVDGIESAIEARRERKRESMLLRKVAQAKRAEDLKSRNTEMELQRKLVTLQRRAEIEHKKQSRNAARDQRALDQKRKEVLRLMEKMKQNKTSPTLNGREIIKSHEYTPESDILVSYEASLEKKLSQSKPTVAARSVNNYSPKVLSNLDPLDAKSPALSETKQIQLKSEPVLQYKPTTVSPQKAEPIKLRTINAEPVKRRVTI